MTITEFLLARITDDRAEIEGPWSEGRHGLHIITTTMYDRLRAECQAKRRIVALHGGDHVCWQPDYPVVGDFSETNCGGDCATMRYLAMVYADHQEYRPEWAIDASPVAGDA